MNASSCYVKPALTLRNPRFCPLSVVMCFVLISDQAAIVSLYSVKRLVSITELECVYYAVRAGSLNIIQVNFRIRNVNIRQQIGLEETLIKEIEPNQLTWYDHVQRMAEERLPKIALKWMAKQKIARGRQTKNWMEGIKKAMN